MAGERIKGETALAYEYFQIYRDLPPENRTLKILCQYEVRGKKRSVANFARWSSKNKWEIRLGEWDAERRHIARQTALRQRAKDIDGYYDTNFEVVEDEQSIAIAIFTDIAKQSDPDPKIFRSAVLGYASVEQIISRSLGFKTDNSPTPAAWQHESETPLAHQFFLIYRDMMPEERDLEKLAEFSESVDGKNRSLSVFFRWSARYNWAERVRRWDLDVGKYALARAIDRHSETIKRILGRHFKILSLMQQIVKRFVKAMMKDPKPDPKAFRQLTLSHAMIDQMQARVLGLKEDSEIQQINEG